MILISHRGNVDGITQDRENTLSYIEEAIQLGYDVEIDLRVKDGKTFLGHDTPDHPVSLEWLEERKHKLWIHTKDVQALVFCKENNLKYFFHEKEEQTLISNGLIWTHDLDNVTRYSVIPIISDKLNLKDFSKFKNCYAICSDFVKHYKNIL